MDDTPGLSDEVPDGPGRRRLTIQERFEAFHRLNPGVYATLEQLAAAWLETGRKQLGIGMLWEVMRWHLSLETTDPSGEFKLDNNYRSRYVRLLVARRPEWAGCFELRRLKAA